MKPATWQAMKKTKQPRPSASKFSGFRQLCNLIPCHLVSRLAKETGVDKFCRTFSAWSHVVAMLYAQFSHSIGLNDVCDALRLNSGPLSAIRGARPPSRNGLSHAGKQRKAVLAEKLFWSRSSPNPFSRLRARQAGQGCRTPLLQDHPLGGFNHYRTRGFVHGLGQTPPPQGRHPTHAGNEGVF